MSVSDYERFAVRTPLRQGGLPEVKGRQSSPMTFLSSSQVREASAHVEVAWIYGIPEPTLPAGEWVLDYDQILLHIGMNHTTPQVLGGTVELYLGGQPIVFNTTTSVFIPKGTPYGPLTWKEFLRPHLQVSIVLESGTTPAPSPSPSPAWGESAAPSKTKDFDYEQYVVRSPMREAGPEDVTNRQNPTMTYMSGTQVPGVKNYIEFGWIWDVPTPPIPKMRHDNYDEIVLHLGSDPDNPEDLGATMQFGIGEDLLQFDTTHCAFIPKGLNHGPLSWKEVHRPMIEFAMMLGAGKWADGWEGSFFDLP
jgi:hypothetical protein